MVIKTKIRRPRHRKHRRQSRKLINFCNDMAARYDGSQTTISVTAVDGTLALASTCSGIINGPCVLASGVVPAELKNKSFYVAASDSAGTDYATLYQNNLEVGRVDSTYDLTAWSLTPTVTADNATNTFTIASHGMVTGEGPVTITSTNLIPAGLVSGTNYYVARVNDNVFKLATTAANAVASGTVSISDDGNGTLTCNRPVYLKRDLSRDGILEYLALGISAQTMASGINTSADTIFNP